MKHCQWCDAQFETKISYKIYCSDACRDAATKHNIAIRYQKKKVEARAKKPRKCSSCGGNLSMYNENKICSKCSVDEKEVGKILKQMKGIANGKLELD